VRALQGVCLRLSSTAQHVRCFEVVALLTRRRSHFSLKSVFHHRRSDAPYGSFIAGELIEHFASAHIHVEMVENHLVISLIANDEISDSACSTRALTWLADKLRPA
jgi:hypothetical protein